MADRSAALRALSALKRTPVGGDAVLVGSSGLFGFETGVAALTEDIDISVPEQVVERYGEAIVDSLRSQGFDHEPGTATFVGTKGLTFDLLGHGEPEAGDHVSGEGALRVMVFEDLSRLLGQEGTAADLPQGGRALTPAAFVVAKLLTERAHKGTKDKIQALLVLAERKEEERFVSEVVRLFRKMDSVRLEDVRSSAQGAFLALEGDPTFRDAGAEGYAPVLKQVEIGLRELLPLVEKARG